jgi:lipopolysaccharide transport system permease protein
MQLSYIRTLHTNRELIKAWTIRTVRARYQQSFLGVLWTIAQPVAQVAIFTIIFTLVIPIDTGDIPYPVFNFAAMAPWLLFSMAITDMVGPHWW